MIGAIVVNTVPKADPSFSSCKHLRKKPPWDISYVYCEVYQKLLRLKSIPFILTQQMSIALFATLNTELDIIF